MSVVLGVVHDATMESPFVRDLVRLVRSRPTGGVIWGVGGGGRLDSARNLVVRSFLDTKAEWLLFLDTDIVFSPEMYDMLLDTADEKTAPIVSGLYFADDKPPRAVMAYTTEEGAVRSIAAWDEGDTIDVEYVGAGFLLVHRSVYEALGDEPYRQDVTSPSGALLTEDYAFCHRARDAGFPVKVNTKIFLGHCKLRVLGYE